MARVTDWPAQLDAAVEAARRRPFEWGTHDCALWAASVVQALTGVDHAAGLRGRYRSAAGALRLLAKRGGLAVLATRALGAPIDVRHAQRGDLVLACQPLDAGMPALGICLDTRAAFTGAAGLVYRDLLECEAAWRV